MSGPILLILRIALVAALYIFLGWSIYTFWQDFKRQNQALIAARRAPTLILTQQPDDSGWSRRFTNPLVTIGRDPASDCLLEDQTISAQHTRLSYHHGHWWVEDLNSTNGTFLNHVPVGEPLVVVHGDELRCGQVVIQIEIEGDFYAR